MVCKYVLNGVRVHEPPYTKAEEADFYRRNAGGPKTMFAGKNAAPHQLAQSNAPHDLIVAHLRAVATQERQIYDRDNTQRSENLSLQVVLVGAPTNERE